MKAENDVASDQSHQNDVKSRSHPVIHDHCYGKATSSKASKREESELPDHVKALLPPSYVYKLVDYEDLERESFTGAPKEAFKVKFNIGNVTTETEVKQWVSELSLSSSIKYNSQGGYKRKGVKVLLSRWYICQCKKKKLTKKQQDAQKIANQKRRNKLKTNPNNSSQEDAQLHPLSGVRNKKTECASKMSIKVLPKNNMENICQVQLWWTHNHSTDCFHLQSFSQIMPATKQTFEDYFTCGMSAAEAFHHHESTMMKDQSTMMLLADRRYCPSVTDVRNMHDKWRKEVKGSPDGSDMFDQLEKVVIVILRLVVSATFKGIKRKEMMIH